MKKSLFHVCAGLLTVLAILPVATACGDAAVTTASADSQAETAAATETETEDPNDRSNVKDNLPDDLDFSGRTIHFFSSFDDEENETYYQGPSEETGEVVEDAVYNRNRAVEERLNVTIEVFAGNYAWDAVGSAISKLILAGDTTYDFMMGKQAGVCQIVSNGGFVNAYDLAYIDFSMPWWNNEYMDELAIGNDKRFLVVGDYQIGILGNTRVLYFNKRLYAEYYDDANALYEDVLAGKWTLDMMTEKIREVYIDLNNDGKTDLDDQLGFVTYSTGSSVDAFVYASDVHLYERDESGMPVLTPENEDAVTLTEKLVDLFYADGATFSATSDDENFGTFKEGNTLFLGNSTFNVAKKLRDMTDDFGFLPYPKFDEAQEEYHALVHDTAPVGLVPSTSLNTDIIGAVLEALSAETYRTVTPAYYETALKVKYSRDDISTQMIDLIHDSMTTSFVFAYNYSLNNIGLVHRQLVTNKSTAYMSTVSKLEKTANKKLEALIETYQENS